MTVRTPPGVINTEATDSAVQRDVHRAILGGTLASFAGGVSAVNNAAHGVCGVGHLEVSQSGTPGMSVDVAAGSAFITGTVSALQGPYNLVNDASATLAIADADTSDDRHDLVIAQIRDDDYDSSGFRDARLTVVTGTPDSSPSDPSLSAHPNALVLARVVVQANASSITDGDITNLAPLAGFAGFPAVEADSYTPSLSNIAIGTGGSAENTGNYVFIGGTATGDSGLMFVDGMIVLGSSGASVSGQPTLGLPSGFEFPYSDTERHLPASFRMDPDGGGGAKYLGSLRVGSATTFVINYVATTDDGIARVAAPSSSDPASWGAGGWIRWSFTARVIRA